MNPLVFGLFSLVKHLPALRKVERPVFILGTGRSGTTILGIVLSMHRDVGFLNEPKALWHSIFPEEDLIGSYSRGPARYRLDAGEITEVVRRHAHRLFGAYLALTLSKRVVDKYPELIFRVPFVRAIFPDARFIFLARNGWDTCQSIDNWSRRLGVSTYSERHDWWGVDNRKWWLLCDQIVAHEPKLAGLYDQVRELDSHLDMAAVEWTVSMQEGLRLTQKYPDAVRLVRYEDLTAAPRDTLASLAEFCGLSLDDTFLEYGCRVLKPTPHRELPKLKPVIKDAFEATMFDLGYM